jgi:FkbM family methyltransferase
LFSQRCSHVYAFEPNVRCISYLWRHLKLNRVHNVTVVPVAVSDRIALGTYDPNYFSVASFGDSWAPSFYAIRSQNRPNQF